MIRPGRLVTVTGVAALLLLLVPLLGLATRTPWGELGSLLTRPEVLSALRLSLATSTTATALAAVLGIPLALLLARGHGWWLGPARVVVTLPLVLPPVAGGMALLAAYGRSGLLGSVVGWGLPFTTAAVVVAQVFVAMPFFVLTLEGGFRQDLTSLEEAAATMGAGRWRTLRYVTLPLVAPALASATVLAWTRALGEFGATITFAGNLPGRTQTMPLAIYLATQHDVAVAYALATLLVLVSGAVLLLSQPTLLRRG